MQQILRRNSTTNCKNKVSKGALHILHLTLTNGQRTNKLKLSWKLERVTMLKETFINTIKSSPSSHEILRNSY